MKDAYIIFSSVWGNHSSFNRNTFILVDFSFAFESKVKNHCTSTVLLNLFFFFSFKILKLKILAVYVVIDLKLAKLTFITFFCTFNKSHGLGMMSPITQYTKLGIYLHIFQIWRQILTTHTHTLTHIHTHIHYSYSKIWRCPLGRNSWFPRDRVLGIQLTGTWWSKPPLQTKFSPCLEKTEMS